MKLLFDENISHRILKKSDKFFEKSIHCKSIKSFPLKDIDIWNYAKENDFTIVTFDEDFYEWMLLKGFPPKIIWLRSGNISTERIADKFNYNLTGMKDFLTDKEAGILELY